MTFFAPLQRESSDDDTIFPEPKSLGKRKPHRFDLNSKFFDNYQRPRTVVMTEIFSQLTLQMIPTQSVSNKALFDVTTEMNSIRFPILMWKKAEITDATRYRGSSIYSPINFIIVFL